MAERPAGIQQEETNFRVIAITKTMVCGLEEVTGSSSLSLVLSSWMDTYHTGYGGVDESLPCT